MSPTKVKQKCVDCCTVFERSKFNPYLDRCEQHRKPKASQPKSTPTKKKADTQAPTIILPPPPVAQSKRVVSVVVEKEKVFMHLLSRGWKLSINNKLFKKTDKVNVVATLGADGSPSQKFAVSFWGGDTSNGFDGSVSIIDRSQLKKLPMAITDDLEPVLNYIWPNEVEDAKKS